MAGSASSGQIVQTVLTLADTSVKDPHRGRRAADAVAAQWPVAAPTEAITELTQGHSVIKIPQITRTGARS